MPKDVLNAEVNDVSYSPQVYLPGYQPNYEGHPMQIKKVLAALSKSKRPMIIAGGGVRLARASALLIKFVEITKIPVVNTFMGLGGIPCDNPYYAGWLGMHGLYAANMATLQTDYILAIGTRFSDRSTGDFSQFAKNAGIAQIDIDPSSISKNIDVDTPIVGDAQRVLEQLIKYSDVFERNDDRESHKEWLKQIEAWKTERPFTFKSSETVIKPQQVVKEIYNITEGEAVITTEVGQNQMWAGQYYGFKYPNQFISSGGLGTMGFGLPAAIGAKIGLPDKEVFDIAGDGSIMMNIQELATASQLGLNIKVAILNNSFLGMVRQWQKLFYKGRYSSTCIEFQPDFVKLAESFRCVGLRAEKPSEIVSILKEAMLVKDKPVLMDFRCDREENVFPMVPAGSGLDRMIF
jgi:acetolactate synthase-1/2/3 large subunit